MQRIDTIGKAGLGILRYGMVFLMLLWGTFKFFAFEALAIQPMVAHSPFLGWLYPLAGVRGTSDILGVFEVVVGIMIATRHWFPRVSGYASLASSGMFLMTLSFLATTPGIFAGPMSGFLMKDIMFLGAALLTGSEALRASDGAQRVAIV